jgi:probable F420-dependent oxidoreductase
LAVVVKLGVHIPLELFSPVEAVTCARAAEAEGLDHVVVNDHVALPWTPHLAEAWTTLAAIGGATKQIRVGVCVTPLPLRAPFWIAKMTATVDQLTGGRLLVGVGAGWYRKEFAWSGAAFRPHAERLAQTEEALQLLQALWSQPVVTFRGRYYQADKATLEPKPVQKPGPPILLGGGSEAVLQLTARYGAGWMPFAPSLPGLVRRLARLKGLLKAGRRSTKELQISPSVIFQTGASREEAWRGLPDRVRTQSKKESHGIFGPPEACLERICSYAAAGATHLSLRLVNPTTADKQIATICRDILPRL